MTAIQDDAELKARHRAMWASGDYPKMVETFLLPLGPRLVDACGIGAERPRARRRGRHRQRLDPRRPARRARRRERPHARAARGRAAPARGRGLDIEWVTADAEQLPFESESFDVVMSSIGVMFAPHHQAGGRRARARLPARRHDRPAELDARGHARRAVPDHEAVRRAAAARASQSPPLWGSEEHLAELFGDRVMFGTLRRDVLEITAFERARDYGEHFKAYYGPDDRRPRQRGAQRPRGRVRRRPRRVLRRMGPRRGGSRRSTCWPSGRARVSASRRRSASPRRPS